MQKVTLCRRGDLWVALKHHCDPYSPALSPPRAPRRRRRWPKAVRAAPSPQAPRRAAPSPRPVGGRFPPGHLMVKGLAPYRWPYSFVCTRAIAQATTMNDAFSHPEHMLRSLCYLMPCRDAQVSVNCGGLNTRVHEVTTKYGNSPPPKYK